MSQPAAQPAPEYILGTDPEELARLGLQHRLWSAQAHFLWLRAGIGPGSRVLDIGCGPGHAAFDIAQLVTPDGLVVGIDESPSYVDHFNEHARRRAVEHAQAHVADVQRLDQHPALSQGGFDAAYARWVFCFLPEPDAAVAAAARLLVPGGRLAVQDYFNYHTMTLAPRRPEFTAASHAAAEAFRSRGGDPDIMGRLPAMARAAGLRIDHIEVLQRIARPHEPLWQWPDTFWKLFVPRLTHAGFLTQAQHDAFFEAWQEASNDPDTYIFLPSVIEIIATKPG